MKELPKEREVKIRRCHEKRQTRDDKGKRRHEKRDDKTTEIPKNGDMKRKKCQEQETARERDVARQRCNSFLEHRWSCTRPVDTFFRPISSSETFHRRLAWVLLANKDRVYKYN